jgi:hypothetical protein
MPSQTTLLTCHKGIDLHAQTAVKVMRDRLAGGQRLLGLHRGEFHTFWGKDRQDLTASRLLQMGRCYNPNKHRYGHFVLAGDLEPWYAGQHACRGGRLPADWPGEPLGSDLACPAASLYDQLLGGPPPPGGTAVDVCTFALGEGGPLLEGVIWRLVIEDGDADATEVADDLIVARSRRQGLLVNPHMQGWLVEQCRGADRPSSACSRVGRRPA